MSHIPYQAAQCKSTADHGVWFRHDTESMKKIQPVLAMYLALLSPLFLSSFFSVHFMPILYALFSSFLVLFIKHLAALIL
jgi:hypothetical protein